MKAVCFYRRLATGLFCACFLWGSLGFASPAGAESLWADDSSLVADRRPSKVGDLVTVSVTEKTSAKDEATTDLSKSSSGTIGDGIGILDFIRKLGFTSDSTMNGDGSTERTHNLDTTITCQVTEVLPGGNLRLEGHKDIFVQTETLTLYLTGIVQPRDVNYQNAVDSDKLAEVSVTVDGIGSINDLQHPGFLTQLFNAIF